MFLAQTPGYRMILAAAFGLAGFLVNFLDIQLFECPTFKVSILAGLFFPLIIALAWGWRYGLLSALAGGCQSMWWLWRTDGWGVLYAVPVFTLWIVWHGWWAEERRRKGDTWRRSCFVIEIPFRIVVEAGFYTIFRWLVSLNPPPWNAGITWDHVPLSWVHTVAVKHGITAYILLLAAYVALSLGPVRRLMGLPLRSAERDINAIFAGAFLLGVFLWMVDALADTFLFHPDRTLWEAVILRAGPDEIFTRMLYLVVSMMGAVLVAHFTLQRAMLSERLVHQNRVLAAIRNVNQLIANEKDRDRLATEACRLLVETRGLYNAWIVLLHDGRPAEPFFYAGFDDSFTSMADRLRSGDLPPCGRTALRTGNTHVTEDPANQCLDCPLKRHYAGRAGVAVRLAHAGKVYGLLCASIPSAMATDEQEHLLIREVADDIGFALHGLEIEKERRRAEVELRKHREHLEEMVEDRTAELRRMVNLMAGREVRMAELKEVIRTLRGQLMEAGLRPGADDPLLGTDGPQQ